MEGIPPTIPFHLAKAYGVRPAANAPRATSSVEQVAAPRAPAGPASQKHVSPEVAKLIAGRVPGAIDFTDDAPKPSAETLPFYRHPADRNAAATAIDLGRALDTEA